MDPDATQPSEPVMPLEAPNEDASPVIVTPSEQATQTQQGDVPQAPTQGYAPQVSPQQIVPPEQPAADTPPIVPDASAPSADVPPVISDTLAPISSPELEVTKISAAPATPAFEPRSADEISFLKTVLGPKAWASHRARTAAKLDKIVALAREKGQIDRAMVRLCLNVSQASATRYLSALTKQGRLTREKSGHDWVYRVAM
jgi:hypothetical protein